MFIVSPVRHRRFPGRTTLIYNIIYQSRGRQRGKAASPRIPHENTTPSHRDHGRRHARPRQTTDPPPSMPQPACRGLGPQAAPLSACATSTRRAGRTKASPVPSGQALFSRKPFPFFPRVVCRGHDSGNYSVARRNPVEKEGNPLTQIRAKDIGSIKSD